MEDDLYLKENGSRPQLEGTCKTTSYFKELGRQPQCQENGRRPQFSGKWKTTSILRKMEDNLNFNITF